MLCFGRLICKLKLSSFYSMAVSMDVRIGKRFVLSVNDSKPVLLPSDCVVEDGDKEYLKIASWHPSMVKLICTGLDQEIPKSGSLAECQGIAELKEKRTAAILALLPKPSAADELFDSAEIPRKKEKLKLK